VCGQAGAVDPDQAPQLQALQWWFAGLGQVGQIGEVDDLGPVR
jgi:hypothetical protein